MVDFISVFTHFLSSTAELDIFQFFVISVSVFGVILLVRKIIYT